MHCSKREKKLRFNLPDAVSSTTNTIDAETAEQQARCCESLVSASVSMTWSNEEILAPAKILREEPNSIQEYFYPYFFTGSITCTGPPQQVLCDKHSDGIRRRLAGRRDGFRRLKSPQSSRRNHQVLHPSCSRIRSTIAGPEEKIGMQESNT